MTIELTELTRLALDNSVLQPNIVFQIDGIDTLFGAIDIKKFVRIGDPDLEIGDPDINDDAFFIGGFNLVGDQVNAIDLRSTSKNIRQTLNIDRGQGGTIQSFSISLIDFNEIITQIITPGEVVDDVLGRKCFVSLGFEGTSYPEDYFFIFRGFISEINTDAGKVIFSLSGSDKKKQAKPFKQVSAELVQQVSSNVAIQDIFDTEQILFTGVDLASLYGVAENDLITITGDPNPANNIVQATISNVLFSGGNTTLTVTGVSLVESLGTSAVAELFTQNVGDTQEEITIDNSTNILAPITGPDGLIDSSFQGHIKINDEIIGYTGISGNTLTGCTRGQQGSTASIHTNGDSVNTFYRLNDNVLDMALKLLLSGWNGPFVEDVEIDNFVRVDTVTDIPNSIFIKNVNISERYGITVGDYVSTSGDPNGANNVTNALITAVEQSDDGSYIVCENESFVLSIDTDAVLSFRSKYDVLPDGFKMAADEVDVERHEQIKTLFFSGAQYDFFLDEDVDNDFLNEQIYLPIACYSLPRKTRSSVGYTIGPIPGQDIPQIDDTVVKNPERVQLNRQSTRYFINEVIYRFEESRQEPGTFLRGQINIAQDSKDRIIGTPSTLTIDAKGVRDSLQGGALALAQSNRLLDRYKFGAEVLNFDLTYAAGLPIELGDIIYFDGRNLQVVDTRTGKRGMDPRFFEVINKTIDITTGKVSIKALDTATSVDARFFLMSPSSVIKTGVSQTQVIIEPSFSKRFGNDEFRKWINYLEAPIRVRNDDFSVNEATVLESVSGNTLTFRDPLSFTPSPGQVLELDVYSNPNNNDQIKLIFGNMTDNATFPDGTSQYKMI